MKKVIQLLIVTLLISSSVFAQEKKDSIAKKQNRVSIGAYFSPNYSFYKGESQEDRPTNEKASPCFKAGFSLNFKLNNYFQIATGASYNHLRYIADFAFPYYPSGSNRHYDFHFITVPILLQINYEKPKFLIYLDLGFEFNHLIKYTVATYDSNNKLIEKNGHYEPNPPFLINFVSCELGLQNKIYKRLYSQTGVGYMLALNPISWKDTNLLRTINQYLYSYFFKVGFNYKF